MSNEWRAASKGPLFIVHYSLFIDRGGKRMKNSELRKVREMRKMRKKSEMKKMRKMIKMREMRKMIKMSEMREMRRRER
jgi:hypothetical protein